MLFCWSWQLVWAKQIDTLVIKPGYIFVVVDCGKGSVGRSYLYVEDESESYCIYKTPLIAGKYEVTVGSNKQCSICYKSLMQMNQIICG